MAQSKQEILFLAQLPPPFHGQSVVTGEVHRILASQPNTKIRHVWLGGARNATDVGKRSLAKYMQFFWMLAILLGHFLVGKRYKIAYLGVAPWAHTVSRDAILMAMAKLLAQRVWVHAHGNGLDEFLDPVSIKQKLVSAAFINTELIAITASEAGRARQSKLFANVHLLPNFSSDPGNKPSKKQSPIHAGIVSNLDPRKGIFEFVGTLKLLKQQGHQVRGTIVGGPTALLSVETLRQEVKKAGLENEIHVTGRISEKEKNRLLASFDIFLYPSRHDLAPLSVIEALAHGCVPVVLATGGIPEIVGNSFKKNVLTANLQAGTFCKAAANIVSGYIASPEILKEDSILARSHFLQTFSKERFEEKLQAMLEDNAGIQGRNKLGNQAGEVA